MLRTGARITSHLDGSPIRSHQPVGTLFANGRGVDKGVVPTRQAGERRRSACATKAIFQHSPCVGKSTDAARGALWASACHQHNCAVIPAGPLACPWFRLHRQPVTSARLGMRWAAYRYDHWLSCRLRPDLQLRMQRAWPCFRCPFASVMHQSLCASSRRHCHVGDPVELPSRIQSA